LPGIPTFTRHAGRQSLSPDDAPPPGDRLINKLKIKKIKIINFETLCMMSFDNYN
jgi:hypothetical protein